MFFMQICVLQSFVCGSRGGDADVYLFPMRYASNDLYRCQ